MHITIENNTVIVNLDETEFPLFEAMFANLQIPKQVSLEFRHFPGFGGNFSWKLLPMHLCRTIGEANLSADPFATVSLYPFWKYGFAFGNGGNLELALDLTDPHKKAVSADEFGMGFCAWAMEEIFHCETWADASAMIEAGLVVPTGSRCPDFVCTFPDGSLGIFEAKGTTGTVSALKQPLATGKQQAMALTAESPIRHRVVIGTSLGGGDTKIILVDPPGNDDDSENTNGDSVGAIHELPIRTNLSAPLVRDAARRMRTLRPSATSLHKGGADSPPLTKGGQGGLLWDKNPDLLRRAKEQGFTYKGRFFPYNPKLLDRARELRKNMTQAERKLWHELLRGHALRFIRQHPIDNYIVDFYCPTLKLVLEVDGDTHYTEEGKTYDAERTYILEQYGLRIIRYTNTEILQSFPAVCEDLERKINDIKTLQPSAIAHEEETLRPSATSLHKGGTDSPPLTKGGQGGSTIDAPLTKGGQGGSNIIIFRGPHGKTFTLTNEYKPEKKHGWLDINT